MDVRLSGDILESGGSVAVPVKQRIRAFQDEPSCFNLLAVTQTALFFLIGDHTHEIIPSAWPLQFFPRKH